MDVIAKNTTNHRELIDVHGGSLSELIEREERIDRSQRNAYYEIGLDLKAIRDQELYKQERETPVAGCYSFTTFEEYLAQRWDLDIRRVEQLMAAATATDKMRTIVRILPSRESHVRELLKLERDEQRAEVWQTIVNRGETVTAKVVSDEVTRYIAQLEKNWFTLEEWGSLDGSEQVRLCLGDKKSQFNKQESASIEWAQWSWNPITGCKHDCPYCYARDLANRWYPQKFEPSIYPSRLSAPQNTSVPESAKTDIAFKNVFVCSMADLFGRWVPDEWIELVMDRVKAHPEWNFLFLTKFPQRFAECDKFPKNAWMGTTVDCQSRVANAEKAFAKLSGGTKWLSVEPMLTPLKFKQLDLFDWVVIGGASRSANTPAWVPPFDWLVDLHCQAREAKCKIYHKDNLEIDVAMRLREFPWQTPGDRVLPKELRYLDIK